MSDQVNITRVVEANPPAFDGEWNGKKILIKLDTSAVMRLEGDQGFNDQPIDWMKKAPAISRAAERILSQQRNRHRADRITLSALDLEP